MSSTSSPSPLHKQAQDQDDHHNAHVIPSSTTHVAVVESTKSSRGSDIVDPDPWYYNARGCAMSLSAFWTLSCGIAVALVAFLPSFFLAWATDYKFELFDRVQEKSGIWALLGVNVLNAVIFAGISAGIVVVGGKIIAGSGLPPLISYISCGYSMDPGLVTKKTLILKNISLTCSALSGVSIGREGPAIQIGAATAQHTGEVCRIIIQRLCNFYPWMNEVVKELNVGKFTTPFSGEYEHEMLHIGAAAGFACAFNAPLGGMMFVYEEIASHWTQHSEMGSRVFFGVGVAIATSRMCYHFMSGNFKQKFDSIIVYDTRYRELDEFWEYSDVPFFILLAIFSGVFTGYVQKFSLWCHRAHRSMVAETWQRFLVAVSVAVITAIIFSLAPAIVNVCSTMPTSVDIANMSGERRFVKYATCGDGEYSQMASLTISGGESMIRHAFSRDNFEFDNDVLWVFLFLYAFTFTINTGTFMPAGNFVPNVIMGAFMGRIWGNVAHAAYAGKGIKYSSTGVYAIIGATCQLCSWTRTMPAIMVTMFEVTSDTSLTTPMLISSSIARSVTNYFGKDGWAHILYHSPHTDLPHHKVHPSLWINQKMMDPKDIVSHPHPHPHGAHGNEHGKSGGDDHSHSHSSTDTTTTNTTDVELGFQEHHQTFQKSKVSPSLSALIAQSPKLQLPLSIRGAGKSEADRAANIDIYNNDDIL